MPNSTRSAESSTSRLAERGKHTKRLGRDGYRAVLALGEIAPEFEGKQVTLAERMDDQPFDAEQLRIIVLLDKRGGRSVWEVARIEVSTPLTGSQ
jgi:hypothetical protein